MLGAGARWLTRALAFTLILSALWRSKPYELDIASHFLPHVTLLIFVFWFVSCATARRNTRRPRLLEGGSWTLTLAGLTLWLSAPERVFRGDMPGYERVRIAAYNTYTKLNDPALAEWLAREQVDLIAMIDQPYSMKRSVLLPDELKAHLLAKPAGLMTRMGIASRWPFEVTPLVEEIHHTNQRSFVAHGTVIVTTPGGARFRFAPMHPVSPRTEHSWRAALRETRREAEWIAETGAADDIPWIIGGDFNSTPGSRLWREFKAISGLRSPVVPFTQGTWPASEPSALSLPIDRVWASPGVRFGRMVVGPRLQSDHRPVLFELYVPIPPDNQRAQSDQ